MSVRRNALPVESSASPRALKSSVGAATPPDPSEIAAQIEQSLAAHLSPITARSTLLYACKRLAVEPPGLAALAHTAVLAVLDQALSLYLNGPEKQRALADIRRALSEQPTAPAERSEIVKLELKSEGDVTLARATALRIALGIGLVNPDAVKVSTVTSELARNILQYASAGKITLRVLDTPRRGIEIVASDEGPGIPHIERILAGTYRSKTGMGLGLVGSKRLMDTFSVVTAFAKGTTVTAVKYA